MRILLLSGIFLLLTCFVSYGNELSIADAATKEKQAYLQHIEVPKNNDIETFSTSVLNAVYGLKDRRLLDTQMFLLGFILYDFCNELEEREGKAAKDKSFAGWSILYYTAKAMNDERGAFRMGDITLLYKALSEKHAARFNTYIITHTFGEHPKPYTNAYNTTNENVYKLDVYAKTIENLLN